MLWKHRGEAFVIKELAFKVEKWGENFYFQDSDLMQCPLKYLWITWNHLIWPCYQSSDGKQGRYILVFTWGKWSLEKISNFIHAKWSHLHSFNNTSVAELVFRLKKGSQLCDIVYLAFARMGKGIGSCCKLKFSY